MSTVRSFIEKHLLHPLKQYPTVIQDTMMELIIEKLETLYEYTLLFPEIVTPDKSRLDILKVIADQFVFSVREDADIQEQVDILTNILYVYNRRGSVDTIENMWKYYGGTLPKDVKIVIPSYKLFRYSVSKLSGTDVFQDGELNRTGVYEIKLINNTYPIPDLRDFLIRELVAAGNRIYFTNTLHSNLFSDDENSNPYTYNVHENTFIHTQMKALRLQGPGFSWSGKQALSVNTIWSGTPTLYLELTLSKELDIVHMSYEDLLYLAVTASQTLGNVKYSITPMEYYLRVLNSLVYCTSTDYELFISNYLYNSQGELIDSNYPGYFILNKTPLGSEIV